jgi:type II secretory pathway predicted ATPase ExeA
MDNPFNVVVPRKGELMINEEFLKQVSSKIKERIAARKFIVLEGDYGAGKSLYLKRLYDRLKTRKELIEFTDVIINVLEGKVPVKNKTLFIKNFDLLLGLNKEQIFRLTNAIIHLLGKGVIILIACRKDTLKKLYDVNALMRSKTQKIRIPQLSYDESRELVTNRLNEARKEKNKEISPFKDKELRRIWRKSRGNPRLLLLLLKPLYERRMIISEL